MKFFIQAATIFSAATFALTIPSFSHPHPGSKQDHSVAGSTDIPHQTKDGVSYTSTPNAGGISVFFSVPGEEFFADPDEELEIEMKVDSSQSFCQPSSVILNDVRLLTQSSILFKAKTSRGSNPSDVLASWETSCIGNEVTLLSVRIHEVLGSTRTQQGSGFSVSVKQGSSPTFLRLEQTPIGDLSRTSMDRKWMKPQYDADFVVVGGPSVTDANLSSEIQEQLRRLHETKARMGRLQHKYMRQERRIFKMITKDFHACGGAACFFQTAVKKAPDMLELVKAHFEHRPDWAKLHGHRSHDPHGPPQHIGFDLDEDRNRHVDGTVGAFEGFEDSPKHFEGPADDDASSPPPFEPDHEEFPHRPPPSIDHDPSGPPHRHQGPPHPPPHHESCHHGPPPPPHFDEDGNLLPPPRPCRHHGDPMGSNGGRPPWRGHHKPGQHPSHSFHRYGPHHHPFFFSLGSILLFAVIASLLFKCVRARTGLFRNNKRIRDRAARREESCNRAAYRRAALRHKWRRWWSQFRHPESTADYEEKRTRLLCQEDALEDVMQGEIRDLRRAHEIVGDLMRAEESRQRLHHEANFGSSSQSANLVRGLQGRNDEDNASTSATLPAYQPPPPSYEQELEGEIMVVDGFWYTPSATGSTPDSSVVDCNSRMSFDTDTTVTKS